MSFWSRFWCLLGPFWPPKTTPFGDPNRPKIVPRLVLTPYFFKNADFHADLRFPIENCQNRPQDGAKIGPRSPQDGLKTDLKSDRFLKQFFNRFLVVSGSVLAPFWYPRWIQKPIQVRHGFLGRLPLERQLAPTPLQDSQDPPRAP